MSKEMIVGLKARKENVVRRMTALDIEKRNLEQESIHLCELVKLYESYSYDPIEEERKVTEELIKGNKEEKGNEVKRKYTKRTEAREKIISAMKESGNPLNIIEISALVQETTGATYLHKKKLIEDGRVMKDKCNKYSIVEKVNESAKA